MKLAYVSLLISALALGGCERSQVNYEKPSYANRWIFDYTGNEMAWWALAGAVLIVLGGRDLDPTDDELNW